jgi:hypothetical protein|tara:strand:+ start:742 stop:1104 length:363 start_codon:yes stop_codon:yes gene_type:complete
MKTIEIVNAQPILEKMVAFDLPLASAVKLAKNVTEINEVFKLFSEKRMALFTKYGAPDEDNEGSIVVLEENKEEFQSKFNELLSSEIEIDIKKLNIEDLGSDAKLSAGDIMVVSWLFKDD